MSGSAIVRSIYIERDAIAPFSGSFGQEIRVRHRCSPRQLYKLQFFRINQSDHVHQKYIRPFLTSPHFVQNNFNLAMNGHNREWREMSAFANIAAFRGRLAELY